MNKPNAMFSGRMMLADELKEFFRQFNIPLKSGSLSRSNIDKSNVNDVFIAAYQKSHIFATFIMYAVLDAERTYVQTNFDSFEDVEMAYANFLIGYCGTSKN